METITLNGVAKAQSNKNQSIDNYTLSSQGVSVSKKVNLVSWGFRQAGLLQGSIKGLINSIDIVYNNYVKETSNVKGNKQSELQTEIDVTNEIIDTTKKSISKIVEVNIPEQREIMDSCKEEISEIDTEAGEAYIKSHFSWVKAIMATVFTSVLGIAIFIFYASLVYSALFKNFGAMLASATIDNFSELFNSLFDISIFINPDGTTLISAFLSVVFLAIGFVMHEYMEDEGDSKRWWKVIVIGTVALIMEVFFALKLETNIHELKVMTGQANAVDSSWSLIFSVDVAIVLILGFISYVVWSILLGWAFKEWGKRDYKRLAVVKTKELNKKIGRAKYKISEFKNEIKNLELDLSKLNTQLDLLKQKIKLAYFDQSEFEGRLNAFFQGWLRYVKNNNNLKSHVDEHTEVYNDRKNDLLMKYIKIV